MASRKMKYPIISVCGHLTGLAAFLFLPIVAQAVVVNGYARVTAISDSTLTLSDVNEANDTFEVGDQLIIYQSQDDVIGSNTNNDASFGNLASINSAGLYEVATISSITESAGVPTSIVLESLTGNTYNTGANSRVQIITFPELGSPDFTTTTDLNPIAWDGNIGGIMAFQVEGVLTLAHDISADNYGFRGAAPNSDGSSAGCSGNTTYRTATTNHFADKGEGIYRITDPNYEAGQAKILNGGGGGASHNGGGGGGGNYSAGGQGGPGWPTCSPSAGGYGGLDLSEHVAGERVFMGGGGGAAEGNNGASISGGDGGGVVLVKAAEIRTTGSCGTRTISANGENVPNNGINDGNAGAGAGGSLVFEVNVWNIASTCPLSITASGGDGGDVGNSATHGGGGGGGMGAILFSTAEPTTNITIDNTAGIGGLNCTTCARADNGLGTAGDGVLDLSPGPLPIRLVYFSAEQIDRTVQLTWMTSSEEDNDYFTVQRSADAIAWDDLMDIPGAGNSTTDIVYDAIDRTPLDGISYYRLRQTDYDGSTDMSQIVSVEFISDDNASLMAYPNPVLDELTIVNWGVGRSPVELFSANGQRIDLQSGPEYLPDGSVRMDLRNLGPGLYMVRSGARSTLIIKRDH